MGLVVVLFFLHGSPTVAAYARQTLSDRCRLDVRHMYAAVVRSSFYLF